MTRVTAFFRNNSVYVPAFVFLLSLAVPVVIDGQVQWKSAASPGFGERAYHGSIAFDGKLWVLHGQNTVGEINDIWYTTNGTNWSCATKSVPYPMRCGLGLVVFGGYLWQLAGGVNC